MASYHSSVPPSAISKDSKMKVTAAMPSKNLHDDESQQKQSREDWRKTKELEEMRKAGTAPAEVDEEGRDINPHIPQYIVSCPWYVGIQQPTLTHQRPQEENQKEFARIHDSYDRGLKNEVALKFRKGACENCGSMTHKKRDCMERPRKTGAKFTGDQIAPDEHLLPDLAFGFDGKRDRWNGYDPREHKRVVQEHLKLEEAKRLLKAQEMNESLMKGELPDKEKKKAEDSDSDEDEDKYADEMDMPGTKVDSKQRISVRNLRIREDTAKYLRNLDPNSAYYDPKTRSMRDNPYKNTGKAPDEVDFAGDNFIRAKGDTLTMANAQVFTWEAAEKGIDVHLQAEPTKLELLSKEYQSKKDVHKDKEKDTIFDKYGGSEHLEAPPKALLLAQTEEYVVYNRLGKIIEGQEQRHVKSKYIEDEYIQNHSSVWGSFWANRQWGYRCCHSTVKQSYCTGDAGKNAGEEGQLEMLTSKAWEKPATTNGVDDAADVKDNESSDDSSDDDSEEERKKRKKLKRKMKREKRKEKKRKKKKLQKKKKSSDDDSDDDSNDSDSDVESKKKNKEKKKKSSNSEDESSSSEDEEAAKKRKIEAAIKEQAKERRKAEELLAIDERHRPYNSHYASKKPTEEEMEAFRLKNIHPDDPMAQFLTS